jgi:hypothetical protein
MTWVCRIQNVRFANGASYRYLPAVTTARKMILRRRPVKKLLILRNMFPAPVVLDCSGCVLGGSEVGEVFPGVRNITIHAPIQNADPFLAKAVPQANSAVALIGSKKLRW